MKSREEPLPRPPCPAHRGVEPKQTWLLRILGDQLEAGEARDRLPHGLALARSARVLVRYCRRRLRDLTQRGPPPVRDEELEDAIETGTTNQLLLKGLRVPTRMVSRQVVEEGVRQSYRA